MMKSLAAAALLLPTLTAQQPAFRAVRQAALDPAIATLAGGTMLSLPGLFTDFVHAGGSQFVELPDGTARLTGRIFSDSSIYSAFLVDLTFTGRLDPGGLGYPPVGAPDQELLATAYVPTGSIDPGAFAYYTAASGTLTGVRNLDGAILALTATTFTQLGTGANNRNGNAGLQATFAVAVVQQPPGQALVPTGPAQLTLDFLPPTAEHATHPQPDPALTTLTAGRALALPGVATDYVFVPAADFTEFGDGHAELLGTLARLTQLDDSWTISLNLQNRITPGTPTHPPVGSPVLQMLPTAYVGGGGVLNPSHWHYYTAVSGTLVGTGINAGGIISLVSNHATQVGGGANQTNTYFGFYGDFAPTLVSQPTGRTLALSGNVELFGLTAVFPVLPFPSLTVPASMPTLPTLTDQGLVLQGDNLAWLELMACNWDLSPPGTASRWYTGYFRLLDNKHVEFHPRPGQAPGVYSVLGYNPAIPTNTIQVQLAAPTSPQFCAEPAVASFATMHGMVHSGLNGGPALSLVTMSATLAPSVAPGIAALAIGAGFSDLLIDPTVYSHDPATGIAAVNYGPLDPSLAGLQLWFQGVVIDLVTGSFPLPATNAWHVSF